MYAEEERRKRRSNGRKRKTKWFEQKEGVKVVAAGEEKPRGAEKETMTYKDETKREQLNEKIYETD